MTILKFTIMTVFAIDSTKKKHFKGLRNHNYSHKSIPLNERKDTLIFFYICKMSCQKQCCRGAPIISLLELKNLNQGAFLPPQSQRNAESLR
jgi:hypothetical protein